MKILKKVSSSKKDDTKSRSPSNNSKAITSLSRTYVGIDIADHRIKMVALTGKDLSSLVLEKYVVTTLENNVINDGKILNEDELVVSLQQTLRNLHCSAKGYVAAMPESLSTIQFFTCPEEDLADLEEVAEFEVNQIADTDEVNFDYQILGATSKGSTDMEILLALTRKEDIESRVSCLRDAKAEPLLCMDIDGFASLNAFSYWINTQQPSLENEIVVICDIGAINTQVLVIQAGKMLFRQQAEMGSGYLDQAIQQNYKVNLEEAIKIKLESNKPQGYEAITDSFNQQVATTIQRALQFFQTTVDVNHDSNLDSIKQIVITGGGSRTKNLSASIQTICNIPTQVINPIEYLTQSKHINTNKLVEDSAMLNTAFGLCLRGFND